jgi:hypothetical protein
MGLGEGAMGSGLMGGSLGSATLGGEIAAPTLGSAAASEGALTSGVMEAGSGASSWLPTTAGAYAIGKEAAGMIPDNQVQRPESPNQSQIRVGRKRNWNSLTE